MSDFSPPAAQLDFIASQLEQLQDQDDLACGREWAATLREAAISFSEASISWVRVSERMPERSASCDEISDDLLIYFGPPGNGARVLGHYDFEEGSWYCAKGQDEWYPADIEPTHWMPLPGAPR